MKYDELVRKLRNAPFFSEPDYYEGLLDRAADAIEELQSTILIVEIKDDNENT